MSITKSQEENPKVNNEDDGVLLIPHVISKKETITTILPCLWWADGSSRSPWAG